MAQQDNQEDRDGLSSFLVRCDADTLRRSANGAVTGDIYIELAGSPFPDSGWSDFVVVILSWWLKDLARLEKGMSVVTLRFMDGPFAMRVHTVDHTTCVIDCINQTAATAVSTTATVGVLQLLSEVERVAADVLDACARQSLHSAELDDLRDAVSRLAKRRH